MLDRINANGIEDRLSAGRLDKAGQIDKAAGVKSGSALQASEAGLISDSPDISAEAKARLAKDAAVKPYVQQLMAQGNSPLDTSRVDRFKQMVANGSINDYLQDVLPSTVEGLLASPEGKTLKVSLR